jgi:cytochrome c oxidase assembly factor CtaG
MPRTEELLQLAGLAALIGGYTLLAAARGRRGHPFDLRRWMFFGIAQLYLLLAVLPPIEPLSDGFFAAHMTQHLLLGDLAPLFVALSLDGPMLRPLLAQPGVRRLHWLTNPLVALPLWTVNLAAWHMPALYDAALRSQPIHAAEHLCFFSAGLVVWMAVLETLPGPAWFTTPWKVAYVLIVRLVGMTLGNIAFWASQPIYPAYVGSHRPFGLTMIDDQQLAGAVMMTEGSLVTIAVIVWLSLRYLRQTEAGQRLADAGANERSVARAVRFERAAGR